MKIVFKFLLVLLIISCHSKKEEEIKIENAIEKIQLDTNQVKIRDNKTNTIKNQINSKVKVIVLQCSNGYGLNDFGKTIESEISKNKGIDIIPFPNKNLLGVTFQGVYDKKYCNPIIEKLDLDYIVMTRYLGNIAEGSETFDGTTIWGYETKILNVKSMNQKVSIRKDNLEDYQDIINHIEKNGKTLINDIENLK